MSITAECTSCGRRYQAPDTMAGKRVRCKQCGNIFEVPRTDDGAGGDVSALAELEKSFHSLDATATGTAVGGGGEDDESPGMSPAPPRGTRANTRFDYPFSREVDNWAPKVFTIGALALLAYQCYSLNIKPAPWPGAASAPWLGAAWFACALLGYMMFVGPMTHAMVRRAGGRLGYEMPGGDKRRGFAAGLVGYVLAYMMWSVGGGAVVALVLGILCGLILTTGAVWLLFRLKPHEVAPTAGYTALGFVLGSAIVSVILFGLNILGQNVMTKTGWANPDLIPASPIAAGFDWINQDQRDAIVVLRTTKATRPAPPAPGPAGPTAPAGPTTPGGPGPSPANPSQAQVLANSSPLVKLMERPPTGEAFEDVLRSLVDSQRIGVLRRASGNFNVAIWDTDAWKRLAAIDIKENAANERLVLSPDGLHVVRVTTFPRLSAQIWEASPGTAGRISGLANLDASLGEPYLIGFISEKNLLVRWQVRGSLTECTLEVIDTVANKTVQKFKTPVFDRVGFNLAVSHDGAMAAIATKVERVPSLLLYDLRSGQKLSTIPIDSLDANLAVIPTGMGFSPDNRQVALLFEQAGNGVLACYRVDAEKSVLGKVGEYFPSGMNHDQLFTGSAVAWLPEGNGWVLYGQSVFSANGPLDTLGGLHVYNFTTRSPDIVEIVGKAAGTNQKMITLLHLDLPKIASMTQH